MNRWNTLRCDELRSEDAGEHGRNDHTDGDSRTLGCEPLGKRCDQCNQPKHQREGAQRTADCKQQQSGLKAPDACLRANRPEGKTHEANDCSHEDGFGPPFLSAHFFPLSSCFVCS